MADMHHGDPYYPASDPESEPEEEPEQPHEEDSASDPESEPEEEPEQPHEEDPDEDPSTDEVEEDSEHEEPGSDRDDPGVVNDRYPIRGHDEPLPPPSYGVYRHPNGGSLWRYTPHKRVLPMTRPDDILTSISRKGQGVIPSTYEAGQSSQAPPPAPTPGCSVDRALLAIWTHIDQSDATTGSVSRSLGAVVQESHDTTRQVSTVRHEVADVGALALSTSARVQLVEADQNLDEEAIQITRDELAEATALVRTQGDRITALE